MLIQLGLPMQQEVQRLNSIRLMVRQLNRCQYVTALAADSLRYNDITDIEMIQISLVMIHSDNLEL